MSDKEYLKIHGASVESDWQRVSALRQICDHAGTEGVTTPAALHVDLAQQTIVYEHATFPAPLIEQVGDDRVFAQVGAALARMHEAPFSTEPGYFCEHAYPLVAFGLDGSDLALLRKRLPVGWLHGDFWYGNVFCGIDDNVVVIDPLPTHWPSVEHYISASGALDLAFMYMSLVVCHPLRRQVWFDVDPYIQAGEVLVDAYLAHLQVPSEGVRGAVRRLGRVIAVRFIEGYARRLSWPLARVKRRLASRILDRVDRRIDWRMS